MTTDEGLGTLVRRGASWGAASTIALRLGSLVVGIVLARLLSPEAFGIFAVAMVVQVVLTTLADLGMSADLIRAQDPERRGPTLASISLTAGIVLALLMSLTASPVAEQFGSPSAAPVIAVMSLTLIISGAGVVPYAKLTRQFAQKQLFATSAVDFVISTVVAVGLVLLGMGPMSLALSRVAAQGCATALQFKLSHTRPRFGFDRTVARSALAFGLPLAGANLLVWTLLNVDNAVIARVAGEVALGYYFLAFNISNWPMSVIGQTVRSVAMAAFAHVRVREKTGENDVQHDRSLAIGMAVTWSLAVPAGVLLAVLSVPLVEVLYGDKWSPAAGVLAALGVFGALRVVLDLMATYLIVQGAARPVFWIQVLWILVLTPAMVFAVRHFGLVGGGWVHLIVGAGVVLPAYFFALSRQGVQVGALVAAMWPPIIAAVPSWLVAHLIAGSVETPFLALLFGGTAGLTIYVGLLSRWLLSLRHTISSTGFADTGPNAVPLAHHKTGTTENQTGAVQ